ncbi:MAG: hypothetical protein Q9181_007225 [Wetmoreana brouardii]
MATAPDTQAYLSFQIPWTGVEYNNRSIRMSISSEADTDHHAVWLIKINVARLSSRADLEQEEAPDIRELPFMKFTRPVLGFDVEDVKKIVQGNSVNEWSLTVDRLTEHGWFI